MSWICICETPNSDDALVCEVCGRPRQSKRQEELEQEEWNKALNNNSRFAYEYFARTFPSSIHAQEARDRIAIIVREEDWKRACQLNTCSSYKRFLEKYPEGKYSRTAKDKIKSLFKIETEFKEWNNALTFNTIIAFNNFIKSFPDSTHVGEAKERILGLRDDNEWNKAIKVDDKESYAGYLSKFPYGRHYKEAQERLDAITKEKESHASIIFLFIVACIILVPLIINSISSKPTPTPVPNEQVIQKQNIPNEVVLSPDAIRDLERKTKEKLDWLKTAKDCGDVIDSRLKSEVYANLKKLEKAGSKKYSSLKQLYDDL